MTKFSLRFRTFRTRRLSALWSVVATASLLTMCTSVTFSLQAESRNDPATMLLGELWGRTGDEQARSKSLGESQLAANPNDEYLQFAFALNRMKHYRFQDAVNILKSSTGTSATRIESWIIRTWSEAVTGQHDRCLVSLREMKRQLQTGPPPSDSQLGIFYRHAGRMIGYLQGPVAGSPNVDLLQSTIESIATGASAEHLDLFNSGRSSILDRYELLSKAEAVARDTFLKDAEVKGVIQADTIRNSNETLAQRRDQVQPEIGRLTGEANTRIADLDQQAGPLIAQADSQEAQLNQLSWNLNNIGNEIFYLQQALATEADPSIRFSLQFRLNQLYSYARSAQYDLVAARSQLVGMQTRLNVLGVQRAQVSSSYSAEIQQQKDELNQLDRQQRKNDKRLEDIIDGPDKITGEASALANKKDLLSTYYVLPLEVFRQDFLDELARKNLKPVQ